MGGGGSTSPLAGIFQDGGVPGTGMGYAAASARRREIARTFRPPRIKHNIQAPPMIKHPRSGKGAVPQFPSNGGGSFKAGGF